MRPEHHGADVPAGPKEAEEEEPYGTIHLQEVLCLWEVRSLNVTDYQTLLCFIFNKNGFELL